jgi:hypothetical protein
VYQTRRGGDEQRSVGADERRGQGLYGAPVHLANFLELRKVVNDGCMDHAVRHGCALARAFEIIKIAAMRLGARGQKRPGAGIRARKAQHLMTRVNELWNDGRTDKARSSCNKNPHPLFSFRPA